MKALIADDSTEDRRLLKYYLEGRGFEVVEAKNGVEALGKALEDPPDLVISDGLMPEMDGFNLLRAIRADERLAHLPFVFYSSVFKDAEEAKLAASMGAAAFIVKGTDKDAFWTQLDHALAAGPPSAETMTVGAADEEAAYLRKYSTMVAVRLEHEVADLRDTQAALAADIIDRKRAEAALTKSNDQLLHMVNDIAEALGRAVEARDPYTRGHQERVAALAKAMALDMGMAADDVTTVHLAGLVHDVGKLAVPAEILGKPGSLSALEFALIKVHPQQSYEILKDIAFPWPVADIARQHHERLDGSGYPQGLSGDAIHPLARLLAVADVGEAMASYRPYRPALGVDAAIAELQAGVDKYDQAVVRSFVHLHETGKLEL